MAETKLSLSDDVASYGPCAIPCSPIGNNRCSASDRCKEGARVDLLAIDED